MKKKSKNLQAVIDIAKCMPPLYHSIPGVKFDFRRSRTLWWLIKQPEILKYIWDIVKRSGAIKYDSENGKWQGVDFEIHED